MSLLEDLKNLLNNNSDSKKDENFENEGGSEESTSEGTDNQEKFVEVKTTEDIILRIDGEMEEGKSIEIIDETGASPAENGQYELEDGTVIEVEEGSVSSLTTPENEGTETEGEPDPDMEEDDKDKKKEEDMKEVFSKEDIKESFNLLINEVKDLKESYKEDIESIKEDITNMDEDFSKFKKEPSSESIKNDKPSKEWGSLYEKFGKYRK